MNQNLDGKVVVITGAGGGIGRAAALAFAQAGAKVLAADLDGAAADEIARQVRETGAEAMGIAADVTRAAEVEAMVAAAVNRFGRLDLAFNNAGVELEATPIAQADEAVFDQVIAVNLKGVFLCLKYQVAQMLAQGHGGAIVNTASVAGLVAAGGMPAYAASKHGVVGLTRTAAVDYARHNIRVNAVCPGVVRTAMTERAIALHPEREGRIRAIHPMGRIAEAEEVAATAVFLCSEAAGFITGQSLAVDGGMTIR